MTKKVINIEDKLKEKNNLAHNAIAREIVNTLVRIVEEKLILTHYHMYTLDEFEILDLVLVHFDAYAKENDLLRKMDEENPPHLTKLKMYDLVCNDVVNIIVNHINERDEDK